MDEELSTADPLAPNGGLLHSGTGNGLLKPCLFCRLARERNRRGAECGQPAGPEWRPPAQWDREQLTQTMFMRQASTRKEWTRSWVPPTRWPRMAACCPVGQERLNETLFILQASTRKEWTRSWVTPTRWPQMAACCPTGRRTAPRPRNRSAEWAPNHQLTGKGVTYKTANNSTQEKKNRQRKQKYFHCVVVYIFLSWIPHHCLIGFPQTVVNSLMAMHQVCTHVLSYKKRLSHLD